ncbi:MAG: asparagine synthase (glutamine-hydrolyzing), partial [Planctomycetota bacterium]
MCGIAGIVRASGPRPDDRALVQAMIDRLRHRGPDGEGVVVSGPATLGHRRLAVIDLSERAAQPMRSPARACWLSYNGEVYGADALRDELASERPFVSRSDSEVVLAAYERWGEGCLERLNGMFAFAVWDEERGRLFLARDRYGQKPLYTARTPDGGLAFASELGALRVLDELDLSLDRAAVAKYLALDCFPSPTTIHRGVRALPPGCFLVWEEGRARVSRYHRRRYGGCALGPEAAAEELWRLLRASVRRRLVSDVPLGIFLSGGVDSSAVLAAAAAEAPAERLRTFSIGFREASFDESAVARRVAAHFGVRHAERVLEPGALLDLVPAALAALDQPLADASLVPTYALCRFAREHVTCALGGDGGDELFAGYDTFLAERLVALWLASPAALR